MTTEASSTVRSSNPKFHLSLDVKSVEDSIRFYSILFGAQPTKVKPGYAKFDLTQPALNLTLQENAPCCITGLSHMGVRVDSTAAVLEAKHRLQSAGLATFEETNTTCCFAVQDKIWVTDPTGYRWEVYVFKGDTEGFRGHTSEEHAAAKVTGGATCCTPTEARTAQPGAPCCNEQAALNPAAAERNQAPQACCSR